MASAASKSGRIIADKLRASRNKVLEEIGQHIGNMLAKPFPVAEVC
jgi:hypothetical protein